VRPSTHNPWRMDAHAEPSRSGSAWIRCTAVTPGFRKTDQVHTYMYARIKFHTYSRHK
jgi:hypothetical protein